MIDDYVAEVERRLKIHGRRRDRALEELRAHLEESAALHGVDEALRRVGPASAVAAAFTPRLVDRAFAERDRIAACAMLVALAATAPLAADMVSIGRQQHSDAWLWFMAFLAPTAAVAVTSAVLVVLRRGLGRTLAGPLAALVALTAIIVAFDQPPARGEFASYQRAVRSGHDTAGCRGRSLASCAADHAGEIRVNYSLGAVALTIVYVWAACGWTPTGRRRRIAVA